MRLPILKMLLLLLLISIPASGADKPKRIPASGKALGAVTAPCDLNRLSANDPQKHLLDMAVNNGRLVSVVKLDWGDGIATNTCSYIFESE